MTLKTTKHYQSHRAEKNKLWPTQYFSSESLQSSGSQQAWCNIMTEWERNDRMGSGLFCFVSQRTYSGASQRLEGSSVSGPVSPSGLGSQLRAIVPSSGAVVPSEVCTTPSQEQGLHLVEMLGGQQICQSVEVTYIGK